MPRIPGLARRVPWLMVLDAGRVANEHWRRLTPAERSKLTRLLRKSKGRPSNLTERERADVRSIVSKLEISDAGRKLMPFGRALRRRR